MRKTNNNDDLLSLSVAATLGDSVSSEENNIKGSIVVGTDKVAIAGVPLSVYMQNTSASGNIDTCLEQVLIKSECSAIVDVVTVGCAVLVSVGDNKPPQDIYTRSFMTISQAYNVPTTLGTTIGVVNSSFGSVQIAEASCDNPSEIEAESVFLSGLVKTPADDTYSYGFYLHTESSVMDGTKITVGSTADSEKVFSVSVGQLESGTVYYVNAFVQKGEAVTIGSVTKTFETETGIAPFITEWVTSTANEVITLPIYNTTGTYNYTVQWGDGQSNTYTTNGLQTHTYATAGTYQISISGSLPGWSFTTGTTGAGVSKTMIRKIIQWGDIGVTYAANAFYSCTTLSAVNSVCTWTSTTDFSQVFASCFKLTTIPSGLFSRCASATNFSNVFNSCLILKTIPSGLFSGCTSATNFYNAFYGCSALKTIPSDLFSGCTAVTDFSYAFCSCDKLTINPLMFGNCFDSNPRTVNVIGLFRRTSWTGSTAGTAPDLWNKTSITWTLGTASYHKPFSGAGNSATSITNYASILSTWRS